MRDRWLFVVGVQVYALDNNCKNEFVKEFV